LLPVGPLIVLMLPWFLLSAVAVAETPVADKPAPRRAPLNMNGDDTPDIDTKSTADSTADKGLQFSGDLRLIYDYFDQEGRDGDSKTEDSFGGRLRVRTDIGITDELVFGGGLAGICFVGGCDPKVILPGASNGVESETLNLDELFLHWSPLERGSIVLGRLQTRFVLRGGVYAKSLDRNDSNNVNITWTDGVQANYRLGRGWDSNFILQRNSNDGTGDARRKPLNFDGSGADYSYFAGVENTKPWGHVVQRAFDVSYLPSALLTGGETSGRREDYWGIVGRVAFRWPQRSGGRRLRAGAEIGYAPNSPTREVARLDSEVSGLAWQAVLSLMDFRPGHSVGINYARTGAGWLLSPQFRPNEELFEIRYQWRPTWRVRFFKRPPLFEPRFRWRKELEQLNGSAQKRKVFDMYVRLTWEF